MGKFERSSSVCEFLKRERERKRDKTSEAKLGERIIVPLDRQFVVYPGGAGVDEVASVDEGDVFYTGSLFYTGTLFCRDAGIEEGYGCYCASLTHFALGLI